MIECEFFSKVSRKRFLARYWRKRPLLIKGGVRGLDRLVNRRSLLQLAAKPEATSRLVSRGNNARSWGLEFGPFKYTQLNAMPKSNWTILVQEVDHRIPELQVIRQHFQVTPQWQFDDIMVSYATDGGGVGPHYDQYDVFLIQGFGCRRWQIGDICTESTELIEGMPLKIIKEFRPTMEWLCEPGDVLYLPPMIPHHGVAVGDCSTFSVGFRSVSSRELFESLVDQLMPIVDDTTIKFENSIKTAGRAEIETRDFRKLREAILGAVAAPGTIESLVGNALTVQKRGGQDGSDQSRLRKRANRGSQLVVAPQARLAYFKLGKRGYCFFANGTQVLVPKKLQRLVSKLFDERQLNIKTLKLSKSTIQMLRTELVELFEQQILFWQ